MSDASPVLAGSLKGTFQAYEQDIRVRNYQLCGILAAIFMVAGSSLDWVVFGWDGVRNFFIARVLSAVVMMVIWGILNTAWGKRMHGLLGLLMSLPLIVSISWMIYAKEGADSPYYAGLNLVMLGAAILMRWTLQDSIIVVVLTVSAYLLACYFHGPILNRSIFFNNLYFLFVTGVFTTAGTWFYNSIRFSEFKLRHDLDLNRAELEASNQKLRELDEAKSRFFANISHELRTPLTLLIAPLESLIQRAESTRPQEERDLMDTMHGNSMRLLKLINDLLDLVRLESGRAQVRTQRVNVNDFIKGLATGGAIFIL